MGAIIHYITTNPAAAFLVQCVNFAVIVAILVKFGGKPFKDFLKNRHDAVKVKIEETEQMLQEAREAKALYEAKLAELDREIEAFRQSVNDEMGREKERILAEADAMAKRIREQAQLAYDQEMRDVMARVRREIAEKTVREAEKIITETFRKEDHDRMVDEFLQKVRSLN